MDELFDDLEIDNILEHHEKKKKVDGKSKGNRTELNLCKVLTEHFGDEFSRALGSGARTSQVGHLPEHAKKTLTGDICVPEGFKWVIECKGGYEDDVNLTNVCDGSIARLNEFIEQVTKDSEYCGRKPIILWKRNRKPWLAMIKANDYPTLLPWQQGYIVYRGWVIIALENLLEVTEKEFWYEQTENSSN